MRLGWLAGGRDLLHAINLGQRRKGASPDQRDPDRDDSAADHGRHGADQRCDSAVMCRCGNKGCLEALAGGAALARDAAIAAASGDSPYLANLAAADQVLTARDVSEGAGRGDVRCRELLISSGTLIGGTLAQLVNFFNPSLIVIGGGVAAAGDLFLASIRQPIYARSLPLATRDLRITRSPLSDFAGLSGAAAVVIDELFRPDCLAKWITQLSPHGHPGLAGWYEPRTETAGKVTGPLVTAESRTDMAV